MNPKTGLALLLLSTCFISIQVNAFFIHEEAQGMLSFISYR